MVGVSRFSVSVDPDLLEAFDEAVEGMGYNRSTAVQVAMRGFLSDHRWAEGEGEVAGAITLIYDHHVRGLMEALNHLQHEHLELIFSSTHVHLDHDNCLEILAVKGTAEGIKGLARGLAVTRGVKQLKLSILEK
ncbi:nickel-responsive transcriptional regulator NikR [Candidatus Bathyarchaeota archaeon]|nr:nickel-responsive transcriptional regulator NikR [Candidatus Bathyarchaeota archaeon]